MKNILHIITLLLLVFLAITSLSIAISLKEEKILTTRIEHELPDKVITIRANSSDEASSYIIEYSNIGYTVKALTGYLDQKDLMTPGILIVMEKRISYE